MDEEALLDFGDYPQIETAGIGDFYALQDGRSRYRLFDWYMIDGVLRRKVVGMITGPSAQAITFCRELERKLRAAGMH